MEKKWNQNEWQQDVLHVCNKKIYVISMIDQKERRQAVKKQFDFLKITNWEFRDAIPWKQRGIISEWLLKNKSHKQELSSWAMACFLSHYSLWLHIRNTWEECIIMEDDIIINDKKFDEINSIECDIYMHGYYFFDQKKYPTIPSHIKNFRWFHAYEIKNVDKVIKHFLTNNFIVQFDVAISSSDIVCYGSIPKVIQDKKTFWTTIQFLNEEKNKHINPSSSDELIEHLKIITWKRI